MSTPSILLLGATGATGLTFLKHASTLEPIPKITAYVRTRSKLPQDLPAQFRIVEGSLDDRQKVDEAMKDADVVVSLLGAYATLGNLFNRDKSTPLADSLVTVKESMKANHVKRVLALSTGAHDTPEDKSFSRTQWFAAKVMPPLMTPAGSATMTAIAKLFLDDDLDYTIFRVPFLTNGPAAKVHAGYYGPEYQGSQSLSRLSIVNWVLEEIEANQWVKKEPALGN